MGQPEVDVEVRLTRVYLRQPLPLEGEFPLPDDVCGHLVRVMRLTEGQEFVAFDGSGAEVTATLRLEKRGKRAWGVVLARVYPDVEMRRKLVLYLSVVKGERFDWAVEKATELGVFRIVPLISEYTAVAPGACKVERWQRLAESAACQSGRVLVPQIAQPLPWAQALQEACIDSATKGGSVVGNAEAPGGGGSDSSVFIFVPGGVAVESVRRPLGDVCALFVGPEGGFSEAEVEQAKSWGAKCVGLGKRILRVETAALVALTLLGDTGV